jgi:hypothetical protein
MKTIKWLIRIFCIQILLLCIILALAASGHEKTAGIVAWIVVASGAAEVGIIHKMLKKDHDKE